MGLAKPPPRADSYPKGVGGLEAGLDGVGAGLGRGGRGELGALVLILVLGGGPHHLVLRLHLGALPALNDLWRRGRGHRVT